MPTFGTIQRVHPRLTVLRGYNPNEPHTRQFAYPVANGVTIYSGQVITPQWNGADSQYEWVLGGVVGATPYIANADSLDEDVIEAGKLPALSCDGQFELQTGFYTAAGQTYQVDVPLTFDGVTGNVIPTTYGAGNAAPIIGIVTRNNGPLSLVGVDSSATNLDVVSFNTHFEPRNN